MTSLEHHGFTVEVLQDLDDQFYYMIYDGHDLKETSKSEYSSAEQAEEDAISYIDYYLI